MRRIQRGVCGSRLWVAKTAQSAKLRLVSQYNPLRDDFRRMTLRLRRLFWNEVDPVVRGVVIGLLGTGLTMSTVGWVLDLTGKWSDLPFTVNMVSSAAAACFGLPIALVLLQYLLRQQEEHSGRIRLRRLAQSEAKKLSDFARRQVEDLGKVRNFREEVDVLLRRAHTSSPRRDEEEGFDFKGPLLRAFGELQEVVPDAAARTANAAQLASAWRYLDEQLRPMASDVGLQWLEPAVRPPASWNPWNMAESWEGTLRRSLIFSRHRRRDLTALMQQLTTAAAQAEELLDFAGTVEDQLRHRLQDGNWRRSF